MSDSIASSDYYWEARFFFRTKASTVYAGYARRRVPRATDAKRRLLARGEVAFAKQMTEGAFCWHPLSHRLRGDSSPINGGAFGAK